MFSVEFAVAVVEAHHWYIQKEKGHLILKLPSSQSTISGKFSGLSYFHPCNYCFKKWHVSLHGDKMWDMNNNEQTIIKDH